MAHKKDIGEILKTITMFLNLHQVPLLLEVVSLCFITVSLSQEEPVQDFFSKRKVFLIILQEASQV